MSTPNPIVEPEITEDVDLDTFNDLFYNKTPTKEEKPAESNEDSDAENEQAETHEDTEDDTTLAESTEEEDAEEVTPAPKPKSRAEIRIEQLLEKARLAEERAAAAEAELNKSKLPRENELPKPNPVVDSKAPHYDDKNEDGTDKYPLGQFDPDFARDHVNYLLEKGLAEQKARLEKEAQEQEAAKAREAVVDAWNEKLHPARERYPDFEEKGEQLVQAFEGIDEGYGNYLTATIMAMDYGPDVLYFLSNNLDEAKKIVSMGPQKATIALGRIEAQFMLDDDNEDKSKARPKVSKAPTPPPRNRGSQAALPEVPDDTDDLDAFAAKLFKAR